MRLLKFSLIQLLALGFLASCLKGEAPHEMITQASHELVDLEAEAGGRLGVYAIDTKTGSVINYRGGRAISLCQHRKSDGGGSTLEESRF